MWCYGVPRPIALDIEPLAQPELVQATIRTFCMNDPHFVRTPPPAARLEDLGVEYRAPADLEPGAAGTLCRLCHSRRIRWSISPEDIRRIMLECRGSAGPRGLEHDHRLF